MGPPPLWQQDQQEALVACLQQALPKMLAEALQPMLEERLEEMRKQMGECARTAQRLNDDAEKAADRLREELQAPSLGEQKLQERIDSLVEAAMQKISSGAASEMERLSQHEPVLEPDRPVGTVRHQVLPI